MRGSSQAARSAFSSLNLAQLQNFARKSVIRIDFASFRAFNSADILAIQGNFRPEDCCPAQTKICKLLPVMA